MAWKGEPRSESLAKDQRFCVGSTLPSDVGICPVGLCHFPWLHRAVKAEGESKVCRRAEREKTHPHDHQPLKTNH